ncbi:ribosome-associated heat shock protein Hsp15 [Devosia enhydra]|uniref:Ribosome-associated heat shock protein Hsp15 n=1 Tax=Devosia enhydra TaxID=665118 RepID=A0A1K2I050_9HYPH|nr:RNA-binding S4 domain-containing protein [Devosia enhydra]SFZ85754.1 ribosome-associated heat shock protein Hsp15 [Devosia enhydra]
MAEGGAEGGGRQRLDRFLFFSRAVKSRTLAQKMIAAGLVRVNSSRTLDVDHKVGAGDVLTMTLHERLLVWRIVSAGTRRGPASEAQGLYEDLSPPPLPRAEEPPLFARRDPGSGRPTKKDRRAIGRLQDEPEDGGGEAD